MGFYYNNPTTGDLEKIAGPTPAEFQYSTSEQQTGKRWIDGKKIYCKVFDNIPFPEEEDIIQENNVVSMRTTPISIPNYDKIVHTHFMVIQRVNGLQYSLPRRWSSSSATEPEQIIEIIIDANISTETSIGIEVRSNRTAWNNTNYKVIAIIEYTKTTD